MIPHHVPHFMIVLGQWGIDVGIYNVMMNTGWGWPIAEALHFIGLCMLMGTVGLFDLRMMGMVKGLSLAGLHRLVPFGVAGYGLSAVTGFFFVVSSPLEYFYNHAWQAKMALMVIAGVNMMVFYLTTAKRVYALDPDDKVPFAPRLIAIVSFASWMGVITCGRVITAFRPFMD